jgi:hypothetical protein
VGDTIIYAPALMEMADAGSEAAAYAIRGLKPGLVLMQTESDESTDRLADLVHIIAAAGPDLALISQAVDRFAVARAELGSPADINWRIKDLLVLVDKWLPLAQDGLKLAQVVPQMAGLEGERRYLILAQNDDELRATGGFISGAGMLVMENGRLLNLDFQDGNHIDNWQEKPYEVLRSGPLYELMNLELFFFRDANLWPDFPTSAEATMNLYSYGLDLPPLDGAIAIDQQFLELLLQATGPVTLTEENLILTSSNIRDNLHSSWGRQEDETVRDWLTERKSFLGPMAAALQERVLSDFGSIDPIYLLLNMVQAIETNHLQIYMRNPAEAQVLAELGWDGRLHTAPQQDFLMIVDMNVGYTKVGGLIQRQLDYQVALNADGSGAAELDIQYTHTGQATDEPCVQGFTYDANITYQTLINQCFWDYVRVYVPLNSQLLTISQHDVPAETVISPHARTFHAGSIEEMDNATTFANFLMLSRSQTVHSHYSYQLPAGTVRANDSQQQYRLWIQKQAGTKAQPVHVTVILPDGAQFLTADPQPTAVMGTKIEFELTLDKNILITLNYQSSLD